MSKRIVIFGWSHSVHVQRWVQGLTKRGYLIKVVSLGGEPLPEVATSILPRNGKWSYVTRAAAAAQEARAFAPDLVHVHYAGGFGLWGIRTGVKPLVVSIWGSDLIGYRPRWLYRVLLKAVLRRATHVTATGQWLKERTCQLFPDAQSKLTIVPFGVEITQPRSTIPAEPLKICYIKGNRWKYGPHVLLKAMREVKAAVPGFELSMAGQGEMMSQLQKMAIAFGLEEHIQWVGFVDRQQMYPFLQQHHLMVMPSLVEGFGVAALEASACGLPVVASNVGGIPEVVIDGETGILVPPEDSSSLAQAVIKLARNTKLRDRMGRAGQEFVKHHYSWEKSLDLMCALYERLIDENARK